jgi:hypothetical protein
MDCARFGFRPTLLITIMLLESNEGHLPESLRLTPCCSCILMVAEVFVTLAGWFWMGAEIDAAAIVVEEEEGA